MRAAIDKFIIRIKGVGGHGAEPQHAKDPIVAAAAVIQALQTIVSRNINPLETAVLSCCTIHAGEIYNVIPECVEMMGTIRMFNPAIRNTMPNRLQSLVSQVAGGLGTSGTVEYINELPPLLNPVDLADFCQQTASHVLGTENVLPHDPSMVGDDFAIYQEHVPGVFFLLGVGNDTYNRPLHSSNFMIDEKSLPVGAAVMAQLAIDYLGK
jgi:amidohydrolase